MNGLITVGYDGSPESAAAAQWAASEAELRGMRLELILAWPWTADHVLGSPDAVAESREWLGRQEAELRARLSAVDVTAVRRSGFARDALVSAGEHSSMLVLGSRGLGALHGFLVGSVSRHVLARAGCPIILVRAAGDTPRSAGEVVLGLDLDHRCDAVLHFAFESAALRAVPLRVVHAWQPPTGSDLAPAVIASLERVVATEAMQHFTDTLGPWREKYPDVEVVASLLRGTRRGHGPPGSPGRRPPQPHRGPRHAPGAGRPGGGPPRPQPARGGPLRMTSTVDRPARHRLHPVHPAPRGRAVRAVMTVHPWRPDRGR